MKIAFFLFRFSPFLFRNMKIYIFSLDFESFLFRNNKEAHTLDCVVFYIEI